MTLDPVSPASISTATVRRALVAGSAHLDILARPLMESSHRDRIGTVGLEAGGTACNACFNLRRLGQPVRLLTAWGTSPLEQLMASHIQGTGVELMVDEVPGMPLAAFSALLTADGDMAQAVSSTPVDTHTFSSERIAQALDGVDYVLVEANLSSAALAAIAQAAAAAGKPVYAMAVSEDKVVRLREALPHLTAAFMNGAECEQLLKVASVAEPDEVAESANTTLVVTRGERGATVFTPDGRRTKLPPPALAGHKTLMGVGDAFSVAVIDARERLGLSFEQAALNAHALIEEIAGQDACNAYSFNALNSMVHGLYNAARNDKLTGLLRRPAFEAEAAKYRHEWENMLMLIDCDHFKRVNDTLGHVVGDQVLASVAHAIKASIRAWDLACRWGGDEFVVLLPRTDADIGQQVAERIRSATLALPLQGVTLSIGLARTGRGSLLDEAVRQADAAMYDAKRAGRNRVQLAQSRCDEQSGGADAAGA